MSYAVFPSLGLMGELGNQMFQIASVTGYAKKYGKEPVFPEWVCKISGRDYRNIFKNLSSHVSFRSDIFPDKAFNYNELSYVNFQDVEGDIAFSGYFQSEKYFIHCADQIREMFEPNDQISKYIDQKYSEILSVKNKVSVQVRTGGRSSNDYDVHAYASKEFLEKCQSHFSDDSLFVVFADNMNLAKQMLPEGKNYFFVEEESNYVDLFFMNKFDSYIVSPSTFGWWGAWLSQNKSAKVTIMKDWFANDKSKAYLNINNDQVPERWIKI